MDGGMFAATKELATTSRESMHHVRIHRNDGGLLEAVCERFPLCTVFRRPNTCRRSTGGCYIIMERIQCLLYA